METKDIKRCDACQRLDVLAFKNMCLRCINDYDDLKEWHDMLDRRHGQSVAMDIERIDKDRKKILSQS